MELSPHSAMRKAPGLYRKPVPQRGIQGTRVLFSRLACDLPTMGERLLETMCACSVARSVEIGSILPNARSKVG